MTNVARATGIRLGMAAAVAVAAISVASCSGGDRLRGVAVCEVYQVPPQLLDPSPGATGVSTAPGSLTVSNTLFVQQRLAVSLVDTTVANATPIALGVIAGVESPAPSGTEVPIAIAYPQLRSATTYTLRFKGQFVCGTTVEDGDSFTTQ